jgi:hypothetical protein
MTWLDRNCWLFLLQLVRCYECEFRHYRPIFFSAPESPYPIRGHRLACSNSSDAQADQERERTA